MIKKLRILTLVLASVGGPAYGATLFTLDPVGGAISGAPGEVKGWGFTFFNDTDYAVITSAEFITLTPVGVFTDFASLEFAVVGPFPDTTIRSAPFILAAKTGVGQYAIDPAATLGTSLGVIQLTYDLYRTSPNSLLFDPDFDLISSGNTISTDASVTVTAAATTAIPEPALGLFGVGAVLLAGALRRAQATRQNP